MKMFPVHRFMKNLCYLTNILVCWTLSVVSHVNKGNNVPEAGSASML
jgi:hypothetical protein